LKEATNEAALEAEAVVGISIKLGKPGSRWGRFVCLFFVINWFDVDGSFNDSGRGRGGGRGSWRGRRGGI
jgi:hypothetical protein